MRSAGRRSSDAPIGGRSPGLLRQLNSQTKQGLVIAALSACVFWLVWIYGNSLRDPNYLNGWMLAGGMCLQVYFHIAIKAGMLSPKSATRWRKIHIFVGFLLIAAFLSHTDFSLPDTGFEWALWSGFVLVTLSGILGTYLAWGLKARSGIEDGVSYDRIPARRAELAREVHAVIGKTDPAAAAFALPAPPHEAWIMDLYTSHLRDLGLKRRGGLLDWVTGRSRGADEVMPPERPMPSFDSSGQGRGVPPLADPQQGDESGPRNRDNKSTERSRNGDEPFEIPNFFKKPLN